MRKFIQVTHVDPEDGEQRPCCVNIDHIVSYMPTYGGIGTFIDTSDGKTMRASERFSEIDKLVKPG